MATLEASEAAAKDEADCLRGELSQVREEAAGLRGKLEASQEQIAVLLAKLTPTSEEPVQETKEKPARTKK